MTEAVRTNTPITDSTWHCESITAIAQIPSPPPLPGTVEYECNYKLGYELFKHLVTDLDPQQLQDAISHLYRLSQQRNPASTIAKTRLGIEHVEAVLTAHPDVADIVRQAYYGDSHIPTDPAPAVNTASPTAGFHINPDMSNLQPQSVYQIHGCVVNTNDKPRQWVLFQTADPIQPSNVFAIHFQQLETFQDGALLSGRRPIPGTHRMENLPGPPLRSQLRSPRRGLPLAGQHPRLPRPTRPYAADPAASRLAIPQPRRRTDNKYTTTNGSHTLKIAEYPREFLDTIDTVLGVQSYPSEDGQHLLAKFLFQIPPAAIPNIIDVVNNHVRDMSIAITTAPPGLSKDPNVIRIVHAWEMYLPHLPKIQTGPFRPLAATPPNLQNRTRDRILRPGPG